MIAYIAFFFSLAFLVGAIVQMTIEVILTVAQIIGRTGSVTWNFTYMGINLMLWTGMTAFLFLYNFG